MKVKLNRPIYPFKSWEIITLDERRLKVLSWMYDVLEDDTDKKVNKKQIKKVSNKAILKNKNTK